jgi:ketosteroid isomerase-like protein
MKHNPIMKQTIFLLFLPLVWSCNNLSVIPEQELLLLNNKYDSALVNCDVAVLNNLYAEDFIYTTPDGEVRNKEQELALIKRGDLKLQWGKSEDVRVKIYGNSAVVTGRFIAKGAFQNNPIDIRERYSAFWIKKDKSWQMVAEQGNFIKAQ